MQKQIILEKAEIFLKIKRIAVSIAEQNTDTDEIVLLGIKDRGFFIAKAIEQELLKLNKKVLLGSISLNKINPLLGNISYSIAIENLANKTIVIVDDVANSGKTLLFAIKPLLAIMPSKLQVAVLVDRQHKTFPISPDFVGYSIATTFQEMIYVEIGDEINEPIAYLN
jgi:pyrimidine operon attenuation protein/uracil phosphoribosyltransferase